MLIYYICRIMIDWLTAEREKYNWAWKKLIQPQEELSTANLQSTNCHLPSAASSLQCSTEVRDSNDTENIEEEQDFAKNVSF